MKKATHLGLVVLIAFATTAPVLATTLYRFEGSAGLNSGNGGFSPIAGLPGEYDGTTPLTITVELPDAVAFHGDLTDSILSYVVYDGRVTLTEANSVLTLENVSVSLSIPSPQGYTLTVMADLEPDIEYHAYAFGEPTVINGVYVRQCSNPPACTSVVEESAQVVFGEWTLVPEPTTALLVLVGLGALATVRSHSQ